MKAGHAHITLVVDRSASMDAIQDKAEEGVNAFINQHKAAPGTCSFLLREFDDQHARIYSGDIQGAPVYRLHPRGNTALFDAVLKAINETGAMLEALPESERPEKVIFVVQTDGEENCSKEDPKGDAVRKMVQHQTDVYKWEFVFLGANLDMAKNLGVSMTNTYGTANTRAAYGSTYTLAGASTVASRSMGAKSFTYTQTMVLPDGTVQTVSGPDDPDGGVAAVVKTPKP